MTAEVDHIMQQASNLPTGPNDAPHLQDAAAAQPKGEQPSAPPAAVAAPPPADSVPAIAGDPSETTGLLSNAAPPAVSADSAVPATNGLAVEEPQPVQTDAAKPDADLLKPADTELADVAKPAETDSTAVGANEALSKDDAQDTLPAAPSADKPDAVPSSAPAPALTEPSAETAAAPTTDPALASVAEPAAVSSDGATAPPTNGASSVDNTAGNAQDSNSNGNSEPATGEKRAIDQVAETETNGAEPAKKAKTDEVLATDPGADANGEGQNGAGKKAAGRPKKEKKAAPPVGKTERKTRSQGPAA